MQNTPIAQGRILGAWVCLVAVLLLWSPMWAAALHAERMSCCAGGMCMAHSHEKVNSSLTTDSASNESQMNCDHGGNGMANCSLSCSHESTQAFAAAIVFVVPEPATFHAPLANIGGTSHLAATEFRQSFEPLSPPPRTSIFSI